jgi:hypothetical protein
MGQAWLLWLEEEARALLNEDNDDAFQQTLEKAELCFQLALRFDPDLHASVRHRLGQIEAYRASKRMPADLMDVPVITDGTQCGACDDNEKANGYSVPWPMDLSAGLSDQVLFDRWYAGGTSYEHAPLDLLFLECGGLLDFLSTTHNLAIRATTFAARNPQLLHWKNRPKPVRTHLQVPSAERLAHQLLLLAIAKQIGRADSEDYPQRDALHPPRETEGDRFLCLLLVSLLFHRTLSGEQRAEVDRVLTLLIFVSSNPGKFQQLFPWIEFVDHWDAWEGRVTEGQYRADKGPRRRSTAVTFSEKAHSTQEHPEVPLGPKDAPFLLFHLRQIWLGWLGAHCSGTNGEIVDEEAVHGSARRLLLGPEGSALCAALELQGLSGTSNERTSLSQRQLWAALGIIPPPLPAPEWQEGLEDAADNGFLPDATPHGNTGKDRWKLLADLGSAQTCVNPCILDPFSWSFESRSLADPFHCFSWLLRCGGASTAADAVDWTHSPAQLMGISDLPNDGTTPCVLERVCEIMMAQLQALRACVEEAETLHRTEPDPTPLKPAKNGMLAPPSKTSEKTHEKESRDSVTGGRSESKRQTIMERFGHVLQEAEDHVEIQTTREVELELEEIARRKKEERLNLELNDLIKTFRTQSELKAESGDALEDLGAAAFPGRRLGDYGTLDVETPVVNAFPAGRTPLQLKIRIAVGSPWRMARSAARAGNRFDAVDAECMLCAEGGLLGLCSWFEPLLKTMPHCYIQTKHCEELFLHRLRELVEKSGSEGSVTADTGTARSKQPPLPTVPDYSQRPTPHTPVETPRSKLRESRLSGKKSMLPLGGSEALQKNPGGEPKVVTLPTTLPTLHHLNAATAHPLSKSAGAADVQKPKLKFTGGSSRPYKNNTQSSMTTTQKFPAQIPRTPRRQLAAGLPIPTIPQPGAPSNLDIHGRLFPPTAQPIKARRTPQAAGAQTGARGWPSPPYVSESQLFEQLVHESVSERVSPAQMQYFMGVVVHAEPLWGETSLAFLSAVARLNMHKECCAWDSILSVLRHWQLLNWPCVPEHFARGAKSDGPSFVDKDLLKTGAKASMPAQTGEGRQLSRLEAKIAADSLGQGSSQKSVSGNFWPEPDDTEKAVALGPRILRIRRLTDTLSRAEANQAGSDAKQRAVHLFESKSIRALRQVSESFASRGNSRNKRSVMALLEHLLVRQFSMVTRLETLVGRTALSDELRKTIYGLGPTSDLPIAVFSDSESDSEDDSPAPKLTSRVRQDQMTQPLAWTQMIVLAEGIDSQRDAVSETRAEVEQRQVRPKDSDGDQRSQRKSSLTLGTSTGLGEGTELKPKGLFSTRNVLAHTTTGVVRLLIRWIGASWSPTLREVLHGMLFFLLTGLCETRHFSSRKVHKKGMVSTLSHRMALHITASQHWGLLSPSLALPVELQQEGLRGLERAEYCGYCVFVEPRRLSFEQLRPLLPIVCITWGERAKHAILSLPHPPEMLTNLRGESEHKGSEQISDNLHSSSSQWGLGSVSTEVGTGNAGFNSVDDTTSALNQPAGVIQDPDGLHAWVPNRGTDKLVSFIDAAADHLRDLQVIDNVHFDPLSRKLTFLMYRSTAQGRDGDAHILLLDASRGMQAIAAPIPASELRPCTL